MYLCVCACVWRGGGGREGVCVCISNARTADSLEPKHTLAETNGKTVAIFFSSMECADLMTSQSRFFNFRGGIMVASILIVSGMTIYSCHFVLS